MTKFWALIAAKRPHIFSLGKVETEDAAMTKAEEFCEQKNKTRDTEENKDKELPEYILLAVLDEQDMRNLTGEVHRPYLIASSKETVAVESPKKRN